MANVEWLLREATDERAFQMGVRTVIDDARWRGTFERLPIGPGLRVFLSDSEALQDVTIEARDDRTDHWMGSHVTVTGGAVVDFLDGTRAQATTEQALLFRPSGRAAAYDMRAGTRFRTIGYGLEVGRIARLFDGEVPMVLRPLIEGDVNQSRVLTHRANRAMRYLAGNMFDGELNGPLRTLMMEGAVIQLMAVQAAAAAEQPRPRQRRALTARERDSLYEARRRLLADMRNPPTLDELAVAVGLSEKRLNAGFRELFGATVFEVLRNERLAHAQIALQSPKAVLKEVAFRVGYNHVSNFISAFTSRYGKPPRQFTGSAN